MQFWNLEINFCVDYFVY